MKRRNLLITAGGIAGAGAAVGTGAFSSVEADRSVSVEIADDADAYLAIEPVNEAYAQSADGVVELNFDDDGGADGSGLNPNATSRFDDVFSIENRGGNDVGVGIEIGDTDEDVDLDFIAQIPTDESLISDAPVLLESGESFNVGIEADVDSADEIVGVIDNDQITISADVDDEDGADELQPVQNVDQDIRYASISDAVDAANEDDTIQVASGTYPESVTIGVDSLTLEAAEEGAATIEGDIFVGSEGGGGSNPTSADSVVIDGFEIVEPGLDGDGQGIGVTESSDVVIQNNEFEGFRTQISLDFAGGDVEDITIQGNTFSNVNTDDGTAVGALENADGVDILNNEFINNRNDIGMANSTTDVTIDDNDFTAGDSDFYVTVRAEGLGAQDVIDNNTFEPGAVINAEVLEDDNELIAVEGGEFDSEED